MKRSVLFLLVFAMAVTSCKKSNDSVNNPESRDSFQPVTKDSYWKYKVTGMFNFESSIKATGKSTVLNGINYSIMSATGGSVKADSYYGFRDGSYFTRVQGVEPNSGATFDLNMLYMKDNAKPGDKWTNDAGQGNGFAAKTPGEVIATGLTMTVAGKTYKDVVHTRVILQYILPEIGTVNSAYYDYYVVKGIGVIRVDVNTSSDPEFDPLSVSELVEYQIK